MNCMICKVEMTWVDRIPMRFGQTEPNTECYMCDCLLGVYEKSRITPFRERLHNAMVYFSSGVDD